MKSQNYGHFFGYKQHMQNSLLLNNTIGNGYFAVLQHAACYSSPAAASAASELAHNTSSILRPNKQHEISKAWSFFWIQETYAQLIVLELQNW